MQCFILVLPVTDPSYIDAKIDEMLAFFKTRNIDFSWTTGPSTRPTNLALMLEAHGFVYTDRTTGMAIDLQALNEHIFVNAKLAITEITDLEDIESFYVPSRLQGLGHLRIAAQNYYEAYAHTGFGMELPGIIILGGCMENLSLSLLCSFMQAWQVLYGVATIPQSRRQGVAAAMTLHALHEARKRGYRIAILSPTEMSIRSLPAYWLPGIL